MRNLRHKLLLLQGVSLRQRAGRRRGWDSMACLDLFSLQYNIRRRVFFLRVRSCRYRMIYIYILPQALFTDFKYIVILYQNRQNLVLIMKALLVANDVIPGPTLGSSLNSSGLKDFPEEC